MVSPPINPDILALQMMRVASVLALDEEHRGGFLLHGALAERDGYGVILAGPGGAGKTTASQRLPSPWRSLSDDATLVVCDERGRKYWGHPWPTWSRFVHGRDGGTWNVQDSVPLKGIFFLSQAQEDRVVPVDSAQAVCLVAGSAEQASRDMSRGMDKEEVRELRLNQFDNICDLGRAVPCYVLNLSQTGHFWCEIERAIARDGKGEP